MEKYIKKTYIQYFKFIKISLLESIKKILKTLGIFNFIKKKIVSKKKITLQNEEKYFEELKFMNQFFID